MKSLTVPLTSCSLQIGGTPHASMRPRLACGLEARLGSSRGNALRPRWLPDRAEFFRSFASAHLARHDGWRTGWRASRERGVLAYLFDLLRRRIERTLLPR